MKYSTQLFAGITLIAFLFFTACKPKSGSAETKPAIQQTDKDSIVMDFGIDMRKNHYALFTPAYDSSFTDLENIIRFLALQSDSVRSQHFYLITDSTTSKAKTDGLIMRLRDAGVSDFEVFNLSEYFKTVSNPVEMSLKIPTEK
ncbi:MAG: hypothetical protein ACK4E0_07045 [Chitinophagaceae bacterium]